MKLMVIFLSLMQPIFLKINQCRNAIPWEARPRKIFLSIGDFTAGLNELSQADELDRENRKKMTLLLICMIKDMHKKAITHFQKAIQLKPNCSEVYNNLRYAYFRKGDFQKAIKKYFKASKYQLSFNSTFHNFGITNETINEWEKVLGINKESIRYRLKDYPPTSTFKEFIETSKIVFCYGRSLRNRRVN